MDIHGLTGMQLHGYVRIEHGFNHEDEFAAAVLAIDHRRRIFGLRGDVAHRADKRFADPVYRHLYAGAG